MISRLLGHCLAFWNGLILMALIISTSSCASAPTSEVQTPVQASTSGSDSDRMSKLSGIQIPGGLADPQGKFADVVGAQGLIHRLDLKSGESQAHTISPGIPLAIQGEMLIGWRRAPDSSNAIQVFAVAPQGDVLSPVWEQTLTMPVWVEIDSQEPERFNLKADGRDDELVVTWEAHSRYSGGAPPPPEVEASKRHSASGVVYIDPKTGTILREEERDVVPVAEVPLPDLPAGWSIVPYLQGDTWLTQSWTVNAEEAFLVRTTADPGIILVRQRPGSNSPPVETRLTGDPYAVASVTPDGRFIFIHEASTDKTSWLAFSATDGKRIAKLPYDPGTQGVSVVDDRVLYQVTQAHGLTRQVSLRSRDIHTGQEMWSFTLQESTARTPPPPAP